MPTQEQLDRDRTRGRNQGKIEEVRNVATYQSPILAMLNGRAVRIIATGDSPGHSPVSQFVDDDGSLRWEETEMFTVIDPTLVSAETLRQLIRTGLR